jgi:hypothetical protein
LAERLIAPVSKTGGALVASASSNPTPSSNFSYRINSYAVDRSK